MLGRIIRKILYRGDDAVPAGRVCDNTEEGNERTELSREEQAGSDSGALPEPDSIHEFCPRCEANLTLQKGYNNELPFWICRGCGEMLINPEVDADDDIAWICDGCGEMLNIQPGFCEHGREWRCTECGYVNVIDESEVYPSEEAYQAERNSPYRGLSEQDALKLSEYEEEAPLPFRNDIFRVRHRETGRLNIRKLLAVYDKSVYAYLKEHPIGQMPRIIELFESENCLIVIEEFIEGRTVEEMLEAGDLPGEGMITAGGHGPGEDAVAIAIDICRILIRLHTLPRPIVHRDIKPSNVMVSREGRVILLDMNVAKWYDPDKSRDTKYLGTMDYAAPEQVGFGLKASSAKSDIYAVGILLNVMLTGCHPRDRKAEGEIWPVIERCISLDAKDRYTAEELLAELMTEQERRKHTGEDRETGREGLHKS